MPEPSEYSESGQPIYRYPAERPGWQFPDMSGSDMEAITAHIERHLGEIQTVWHEMLSDRVHVDVHHIPPRPERNFHTLVTTGMSDLPMNAPAQASDRKYAELMIALPPEWPMGQAGQALTDEPHFWPVHALKFLARFPHLYNSWLWNGHTIPNGDPPEPIAADTRLCCMALLTPLRVPDAFRELRISPEKTVHFWALVPLYREEMELKLKRGMDEVTDLLDRNGIDELLNTRRKNVCKRSLWPFG